MITWLKKNIGTVAFVFLSMFMVYAGVASLVFRLRHPWAASGHNAYCALEMLSFQHVTKRDCGE